MRRLSAWLAGGAAGIAAYRLTKRLRTRAPEPPAEADPRAEELRARLAETKDAEPEPEQIPEPEEPQDVDARRRGVHEHARAAIDEMRGDGSS